MRSVGAAYLRDGIKTYEVTLKTFLKDEFFRLPNHKADLKADFVILTREPAQTLKRKYFWNSVGLGQIMDGISADP